MDAQDKDDRTLISKAKVEEIRADTKTARLEQVRGPGSPRFFRLILPNIVIGRDDAADIQVESQELSRRHIRLARIGDEVMCVDLDSVNGVLINGVKVHSAVLRDGDNLQLANAVFIFHGRA